MSQSREAITLFVCGDVMTGRGIDQILPHPGDPRLHEPYVQSAREYLALAQHATGPLPQSVAFDYIWGDARAELERTRPDAAIVNLETAVTSSNDYWRGKSIHYRMHPANVACLRGIDCCVLGNNHVLDWGYAGLEETLSVLHGAGLRTAGAGLDRSAAAVPARLDIPGAGRVLVFSYGTPGSGVPAAWAAGPRRPGVNFLDPLTPATVHRIAGEIAAARAPGDIALVSLHWGGNWGYRLPPEHRAFAHGLIEAGVDVVHGHSSHHPLGIEVYRGRLILYGCGDLLNDYEGIGGYSEFRGDLALMYFPRLDSKTGALLELSMAPTQTRHFRIQRATQPDAEWLRSVLNREGRALGTRIKPDADGRFLLEWYQ